MHGNLPEPAAPAINPASASGSDSEITSALDSDGSDWFGELARPLLGKEPGVALHYIVGSDFPASTCAKYVAKTEASRRQPPGFLIRALLRSRYGGSFLTALMHGCREPWWIELQFAARVGNAAISETRKP